MIAYCELCLAVNTRPNSQFQSGVCSPCVQKQKERSQAFGIQDLIYFVESKLGRNHNSLAYGLGVSGGKDSLKQALFARENISSEVVLVNTAVDPKLVTNDGIDNFSNLIDLGFSVCSITPNPQLMRSLCRYAFFELGNVKIPMELALFSGAFRGASLMGIDVLLWGENPATTVGESSIKTENTSIFDGSVITKLNTISRAREIFELVPHAQNWLYSLENAMANFQGQIVFLEPVMPNWSNLHNAIFSIMQGFKPRKDKVDLFGVSAVDEPLVVINQYLKYLKYGYSRTTDIVNELIRGDVIDRKEGIKLVEEWDSRVPKKEYFEAFARYIECDIDTTLAHCNSVINKDLFQGRIGNLTPKFKVGTSVK